MIRFKYIIYERDLVYDMAMEDYFIEKILDKTFKSIKSYENRKQQDCSFKEAFRMSIDAYSLNYCKNIDLIRLLESEEFIYKKIKKIFDAKVYTNETFKTLLSLLSDNAEVNDNEILKYLENLVLEISKSPQYSERILTYINIRDLWNNDIEIKKMLEKINENTKNKMINETESVLLSNSIIQQKKFYKNLWYSTLFLHKDENKLTLEDMFIMPGYKLFSDLSLQTNDIYDDLELLLTNIIENDTCDTHKPLVILGKPGGGKSSIIAFLCSKYYDDNKVLFRRFHGLDADIIFYKGLLSAILDDFEIDKKFLKNKILILDGLDEIVFENKNEKLLDFCQDIDSIEGLRVIITCRENYIEVRGDWFDCIVLQYFLEDKIENYVFKYNLKLGEDKKINNVNNVLGIPHILYIVLTLNIDVNKNDGYPQLYNKIFAENNGIYDRIYMPGIYPTKKIKKKLHIISQEIAFYMFSNQELEISYNKFHYICEFDLNIKETEHVDYVKSLFYIESENRISFVHKTIYEYFVAEYILAKFQDFTSDINANCVLLSHCFCNGLINDEIFNYLKFRINNIGSSFFEFYFASFINMLEKGFCYFVNSKTEFKNNILESEAIIFSNTLKGIKLLSLRVNCFSSHKYETLLLKQIKNSNYSLDLTSFSLDRLNLSHIEQNRCILNNCKLINVNFSFSIMRDSEMKNIRLINSNFTNAKLSNTKMNYADLNNVKFIDAVLEYSILKNATIIETSFANANLNNVNFGNSIFRNVEFKGAKLHCAIFCNSDLRNTSFENSEVIGISIKNCKLLPETLLYIKKNIGSDTKANDSLKTNTIYISEKDKFLSYTEYMNSCL